MTGDQLDSKFGMASLLGGAPQDPSVFQMFWHILRKMVAVVRGADTNVPYSHQKMSTRTKAKETHFNLGMLGQVVLAHIALASIFRGLASKK